MAGDEDGETKKSQLPFYLACGAVMILSIASISAVLIIKIRLAATGKNNEQ